MQSSPQVPEQSQCPVCRAEVSRGEVFCGACGSKLADTPVEEIRSLNYLLSELSRWEETGIVEHEQASKLRESYEARREELRTQLTANRQRARQPTSTPDATRLAPGELSAPLTNSPPRAPEPQSRRRALLETLSDPHTIRLLLYTGAAMLVVGVVVWLHDILYLKLQEPIVQATLLMIGTIAVTVSGWLTILRTRLRLTGRALTLTGSLLVPVNFWFLVRSGLIENNGRAWLVCAFCAALYALTAATLRERLYVYLASVAVIATAWTSIYRIEREAEAFGLYALSLMAISLLFLHLSQLFPAGTDEEQRTNNHQPSAISHQSSPLSSELWESPLVHVALAGAALSLLFYMPLRFGSASFDDKSLLPLFSYYDSRVALLLFAAAAYVTWFTGQRIFTQRRTLLYTLSALCLFWMEFLAADGQGLSGSATLLLLTATAFLVALVARLLKSDAWALAFHHASLIVTVVLATMTYSVISATLTSSLTHSLILIFLVSTYAISGSARFNEEAAGETGAHASVAYAAAAFGVVQAIIHLRVGDSYLLAPSVALGAVGLIWFGVSLRAKTLERVRYFRAGLLSLIAAFVLAALSTGFDPVSEVEIYTSPVAVLLLCVAFLFARRQGEEYTADAGLLLWAGSLLLAAPLLLHALQYRLLLDVPAPWRDLATLCASLGLLIFGIVGRLRAPVLVGGASLLLELSALALTSVDWLQIPLKVYLISTGGLILLIWGLLEFRREQILLMRRRFNERREYARERFGEWK